LIYNQELVTYLDVSHYRERRKKIKDLPVVLDVSLRVLEIRVEGCLKAAKNFQFS
jgi:hypothetical protein